MKRPSQQRLAQLHDGELSPRQAKRLEEELAKRPEERKQLEYFEKMGDMLRLMSEEKSFEVSFEGFSQRVQAGIRAQSDQSLLERAWIWVSEFFEHRKIIWVPAAAVVSACLAVVLALPLLTGAPSNGKGPEATPEIWTASAQARGFSKVDSVSFGDINGKVYQLSDGRGGSAAVVWIEETN